MRTLMITIVAVIIFSKVTSAQRVTSEYVSSGWTDNDLSTSSSFPSNVSDCYKYYVNGNDLYRSNRETKKEEPVDRNGWSGKTVRVKNSYIYWVSEGKLYKARLYETTMDVNYERSTVTRDFIYKCTRASCVDFVRQVGKCHQHRNK